MQVTRRCAGSYAVSHMGRTVLITKVYFANDGTYWIAAAQWDRDLITDPLPTKRAALFNAESMLNATERG